MSFSSLLIDAIIQVSLLLAHPVLRLHMWVNLLLDQYLFHLDASSTVVVIFEVLVFFLKEWFILVIAE
jgi:hypothetical protein